MVKAYIFVILIYLTAQSDAVAGAWIIPKGQTQFIIQNTNAKADLHGRRYNPGGIPIHLYTNSLSTYIEHGVTNRISLGMNAYGWIKQVEDDYSGQNTRKSRLDFIEIFSKINLYKGEIFVLSSQLGFSMPGNNGYEMHYTQAQSRPYKSYEARLMLGMGSGNGSLVSAILGGDGSFVNFEVAYRKNENFMNYNEARYELDYGIKTNDEVLKMVLLQVFRTNKIFKLFVEGDIPQSNGFMKNDITQFAPSILLDIGQKTLLQIGVFSEIRGRFIGKGEEGNNSRGFTLGVWF